MKLHPFQDNETFGKISIFSNGVQPPLPARRKNDALSTVTGILAAAPHP
jgi:hypothetical protein